LAPRRSGAPLEGVFMSNQEPKVSLVQAQLGPMANFVYIIGDPSTKKVAIVDPAWEIEKIVNYTDSKGYTIEQILITHYHQDHLGGHLMGQNIQGAAELVGKVNAKV